MGKVVVIGSSNTDMVFRTDRIPRPGETVMGSTFDVIPGGKGANQAVAAARAGAEVVFVAKVGEDDLGKTAIAGYRQDGINTNYIFTDPQQPSGVAMILVDTGSGANSIVVAPGSNAHLSPQDIAQVEAEIASAAVLLVQLEIPLETVHAALAVARRHQVMTVLNPAPAQTLSDELLQLVDIITPNETETEVLVGIVPDQKDSIQVAGRQLLAKVHEAAIITLGEQGVYVHHRQEEGLFVPTTKVVATDTTAAGDVFNGYLAAGLAAEHSLPQAIAWANRAAAISVTRMGAQPSIPYRTEVVSSE